VKCINGAGATGSRLVLRVVYGCIRGAGSLCGLIVPEKARGGYLMSDVLAEVNFAALQQPSGAVVRLDRKFAALVTFFKTASDALSRAGGVFVVLVRVAFLLLLRRGIFLLAACILGKAGKLTRAVRASKPKNLLACFIFAASCE
jgi:hypothetical protein